MIDSKYMQKSREYMEKFCNEIGSRHVGSKTNILASEYFREELSSFDFLTHIQVFDCIDWEYGDVLLEAENKKFESFVSPYSFSFNGIRELSSASSLEDLHTINAKNTILLLYGELAKEQLMPKNYPFYNPKEHQEIVEAVEKQNPAAIIAMTSKNPDLAGALYPFPLFEDGDFNIPSVYISDENGPALLENVGKNIRMEFESERIVSKAYNVIGRKGNTDKKIVICAHLDTKTNSPGALDNAAGLCVLLLLAQMVSDYCGALGVEIVALNGEEYYSAKGHLMYVEDLKKDKDRIVAGINIDGAGYKSGKSTYSLFSFKKEESNRIKNIFESEGAFREVENWYQSDHMLFVINDIKAIAITSESLGKVLSDIAHTEKDIIENVDHNKLVEIAETLKRIILEWNG